MKTNKKIFYGISFLVVIFLLYLSNTIYEPYSNLSNFEGEAWRLASGWNKIVPLEDKPINYLEIGTFYGANLISVAESYGKNPNSVLYCIDPWEDYEEYAEYKNEQESIYNTFLENIKKNNLENKVKIMKGYSHNEVPKLQDDFFDIIYIDGNHQPEYVLEDGVLAFRKLKVGGFIIFDDYGWNGPDVTQRGIDAFVSAYFNRIEVLNINYNGQSFIRKIPLDITKLVK